MNDKQVIMCMQRHPNIHTREAAELKTNTDPSVSCRYLIRTSYPAAATIVIRQQV